MKLGNTQPIENTPKRRDESQEGGCIRSVREPVHCYTGCRQGKNDEDSGNSRLTKDKCIAANGSAISDGYQEAYDQNIVRDINCRSTATSRIGYNLTNGKSTKKTKRHQNNVLFHHLQKSKSDCVDSRSNLNKRKQRHENALFRNSNELRKTNGKQRPSKHKLRFKTTQRVKSSCTTGKQNVNRCLVKYFLQRTSKNYLVKENTQSIKDNTHIKKHHRYKKKPETWKLVLLGKLPTKSYHQSKITKNERARSLVSLELQSCKESKNFFGHFRHLFKFRPGIGQKRVYYVYPAYKSLDPYFFRERNGERESYQQSMNIEMLRIHSFATFPSYVTVRPLALARSGFYFTGEGDFVKCYSCGITHSNWRHGDTPNTIRKQISPNCRHLAGNDSTNSAISFTENVQNNKGMESTASLNRDELNQVRFQERLTEQPSTKHQAPPSGGNRSNIKTSSHLESQTHHSTEHKAHNQASGFAPGSKETKQIMTTSPGNAEAMPHHEPNQSATPAQRTPVSAHSSIQTQQPLSTICQPSSTSCTPATGNMQSHNNHKATIERLTPMGVNFERPKYPSYAIMAVRMSSFKNGWPCNQTPKALAEAGFFFIGNLDYVRCFFCGGGLKNWEDGDDPWVEHARWFPKCVYLRQNKGDGFINLVQEISKSEETENVADLKETNTNDCNSPPIKVAPDVKDKMNNSTLPNTKAPNSFEEETKKSVDDLFILDKEPPESLSSHPAYQSVKETGYNDNIICSAIKVLQQRGVRRLKAADILDVIFQLEERDDISIKNESSSEVAAMQTQEDAEMLELFEENRRLKEERLCRVCWENDACIAMLPCGHLSCCSDCAPAMRKCPMCEAFVKGQVRTWLA